MLEFYFDQKVDLNSEIQLLEVETTQKSGFSSDLSYFYQRNYKGKSEFWCSFQLPGAVSPSPDRLFDHTKVLAYVASSEMYEKSSFK